MSHTTLDQQQYQIREGTQQRADAPGMYAYIEGLVTGRVIVAAYEYAADIPGPKWFLTTYTDIASEVGVATPSTAQLYDAHIALQWVEFITSLYAAKVTDEDKATDL